jgi:hypothetical protein
MKAKERLENWKKQEELQGSRNCDCGFALTLHITKNNNRYWTCPLCSDKFCYTDDGKKDFEHTKWCQDDFA